MADQQHEAEMDQMSQWHAAASCANSLCHATDAIDAGYQEFSAHV
ncbi:hypothetical protein LMG29542_08263 [Paraburkholderia humisilvae]|uniref:Uncharacterized protein n=2 Tax=Paraburkholderia humisilvae TaxID=627669 RepID=A0A6J5FAN7_9BURK|nr:hypothetical protein LMG29542_08263 [Paraburkholderia humisilvae]